MKASAVEIGAMNTVILVKLVNTALLPKGMPMRATTMAVTVDSSNLSSDQNHCQPANKITSQGVAISESHMLSGKGKPNTNQAIV
jgi:hypothetical protein